MKTQLKAEREKQNMTLGLLAIKSGIPLGQLGNMDRDINKISINNAVKLTRALGVVIKVTGKR